LPGIRPGKQESAPGLRPGEWRRSSTHGPAGPRQEVREIKYCIYNTISGEYEARDLSRAEAVGWLVDLLRAGGEIESYSAQAQKLNRYGIAEDYIPLLEAYDALAI